MYVDRNSPIPLYFQLKQILLNQIEGGDLKPGDIFPTEQKIQETYDLSRTTVRQALSELEDEGKITRHRGRGTFVAKPKVRHSPKSYPNLADHMLQQGSTPGWKLLSAEWVTPDPEIAEEFKITADQHIFRLERLRLENDEPIGYHMAYVAPAYSNVIDPQAFTEGGSLRYLRGLSILQSSLADRTLEAVHANSKLAQLLDVEEDAALLKIHRTIYTPEQETIERFSGIYRGDRFQYHINGMLALSHINS